MIEHCRQVGIYYNLVRLLRPYAYIKERVTLCVIVAIIISIFCLFQSTGAEEKWHTVKRDDDGRH